MAQDGLHRVLGTPGTVEIGGRSFTLSPPTWFDKGELLQFLSQRRKNPIEVVGGILSKIDPSLHKELIAEAIRQASRERTVDDEELKEYLNTWDGSCHTFFLMARPAHPELTLDATKNLLNEYANDRLVELWGMMDAATGILSDMAALGNSARQSQETADPETTA